MVSHHASEFPAKPRGGRPRSDKTGQLIERIRDLRKRGKPIWTLAREFWPNLSAQQARARLYTFASKHKREI